MRGNDQQQDDLFSYVPMEKRVPKDHPLRRVRAMTDTALQRMSPEFDALYARLGRPSIAPERLLRALLVQALYSVRSERQLMERLEYDLLFRWFVGLRMDEPVWDQTVFTKNRDRLLDGKIAELFFDQVLAQADEHQLLSDEHFTVDGTLIEAWANRRSFKEKKDPPEQGSGRGGKKLLRDTHESETDPEARLYKKSAAGEAKPGLFGAPGDGEPQRVGEETVRDRGGNAAGAGRGVADAGGSVGTNPGQAESGRGGRHDHGRRGQGVSGAGFYRGIAETIDHPAHCRVRKETAELVDGERAGRFGISDQSDQAETGGEDFWLAESGGGTAQDQIPRASTSALDLVVGRRGVQPDAHGEVDPRSLTKTEKLGRNGKSGRNRGVAPTGNRRPYIRAKVNSDRQGIGD